LKEVYVWLVSQIGKPIDEPAIAVARVITKAGVSLKSIEKQITETVDKELEHIDKFCKDLSEGKYLVC
jgi:S-adenosylmethionine synthetase